MIDELRSPTEHEWEEFLILAPGLRRNAKKATPHSFRHRVARGMKEGLNRRHPDARATFGTPMSAWFQQSCLNGENRPIYLTDEVSPGSYFLTL